jgi:AraC-like DNA-binding protein
MSYDKDLLFSHVSFILSEHPESSLGTLSRQLGVSARTLETVISERTGKAFRFLREAAMISAVGRLLAQRPLLAIKEISYAMGYRSPRSFARAVRRVCGLTPAQLRFRAGQTLLSVTDSKRSLPDAVPAPC